MSLTRPSGAGQEPFDAIPVWVQERSDLVGNAKRLYGALSSAQRMKWQPTYADLAARLGASQRSIVRWVQQLVDAGLIAVRRRGQGLANLFTVLGLVTSGGDTTSRPAVTGWQDRLSSPLKRRMSERNRNTQADFSQRNYLESRRGLIQRR